MGRAKSGGNQDGAQGRAPHRFRWIVIAAISISISVACTIALSTIVLSYYRDVRALRSENAPLQEMADALELGTQYVSNISSFDVEMRKINPDYVCWIRMDGTLVNYPVVRAADNEKYLDTSFSGERNMLGTLFMDYRSVDEQVPHIIIYGHNSRDGDMFGELWKFVDGRHLAAHPIITLIVDGRFVEYEIFSARVTDVTDPAYNLDLSDPGSFHAFLESCGAPLDSTQILTLSTCVSGDDDDERVVVQAFLRG